jgi:hypothetical protein
MSFSLGERASDEGGPLQQYQPSLLAPRVKSLSQPLNYNPAYRSASAAQPRLGLLQRRGIRQQSQEQGRTHHGEGRV